MIRLARFARTGRFLAGIALLIAVGGLVHVADQHNRVIDISRDARSSLDPKSIAVLELLPGPLEVIACVPPTAALRQGLADFFARYTRYKTDLVLSFIDPRAAGDDPRTRGARLGEIYVFRNGRRERLEQLTESGATNAFARLARGGERFVTLLAGNGERRVSRQANGDLSMLGSHLESRGLRVREYLPGQTADVPDNTTVLVIASPAVAYAPGELEAIYRYVARGGNLLWLTEPDAPAGLAPLERALGFSRFPGTIVDPVGLTKFRNPAYAVALTPTTHAVVRDFNQTVAMPYATALAAAPNIDWTADIIAQTEAEAWTETGSFEGNVGFDSADEIQGTLTLALALTKATADGRIQRIVVVGDGDFLANSFVENLGNKEFGRRLLEWLTADDALIDLAVQPVPDSLLDLAMWQRVTLFLFFGVGLPLAFAMNAGLHWWRRRHA